MYNAFGFKTSMLLVLAFRNLKFTESTISLDPHVLSGSCQNYVKKLSLNVVEKGEKAREG